MDEFDDGLERYKMKVNSWYPHIIDRHSWLVEPRKFFLVFQADSPLLEEPLLDDRNGVEWVLAGLEERNYQLIF